MAFYVELTARAKNGLILFEIEDETVTVLHIRHQKRQPFEMDDI